MPKKKKNIKKFKTLRKSASFKVLKKKKKKIKKKKKKI